MSEGEAAPDGVYVCRRCGLKTPDPNFELCTSGQHYGKYLCPRSSCNAFIKWVAKPDAEKRPERATGHKNLVQRFGRGYCELCLCRSESLKQGESLAGHHTLEYTRHEGEATAENILIVCTSCHELIHLLRRQAKRARGVEALYGEPEDKEE